MIPRCTGSDCASPTHRDRLLRAIVGTGFNSGDEMPGDCTGSDPCDEPDGTMASGTHHTRAARTCDRASLLICDVRDLVRPARRNRRALCSQKSADAFRVAPSDAKHRHLLPLRPPPLHLQTHGLRLGVALARITDRKAPVQATGLAGAPFATTGGARHACAIAPCGPCADDATSAISGHHRIPRRATRQSPRSQEWRSPPP